MSTLANLGMASVCVSLTAAWGLFLLWGAGWLIG